MAHDVVISYSTRNRRKAFAILAFLELNGLTCWIAPRNIQPSATWDGAIADAIAAARAVVLVFSAEANASPEVAREFALADSLKIPVIVIRIDGTTPTGSFAYRMVNRQWIEADKRSLAEYGPELLAAVRDALKLPHVDPVYPSPLPNIVILGAGVIVILLAASYFLIGPQPVDTAAYLKVTPAPDAANRDVTFSIAGKPSSARVTAAGYTYGPYALSAETRGCLEIPGYPTQLLTLKPSQHREFNAPAEIDWPVIVAHGSPDLFAFLSPGQPSAAFQVELRALDPSGRIQAQKPIPRYGGGFLCLMCPDQIQLPPDVLRSALSRVDEVHRNRPGADTMETAFAPAPGCDAAPPATIQIVFAKGTTLLEHSYTCTLNPAALLKSRRGTQLCTVSVGPSTNTSPVTKCE